MKIGRALSAACCGLDDGNSPAQKSHRLANAVTDTMAVEI